MSVSLYTGVKILVSACWTARKLSKHQFVRGEPISKVWPRCWCVEAFVSRWVPKAKPKPKKQQNENEKQNQNHRKRRLKGEKARESEKSRTQSCLHALNCFLLLQKSCLLIAWIWEWMNVASFECFRQFHFVSVLRLDIQQNWEIFRKETRRCRCPNQKRNAISAEVLLISTYVNCFWRYGKQISGWALGFLSHHLIKKKSFNQ